MDAWLSMPAQVPKNLHRWPWFPANLGYCISWVWFALRTSPSTKPYSWIAQKSTERVLFWCFRHSDGFCNILHVYRGWRWPIGLRSNQAFFLRRMFYPGGSDGYGQQLRPPRVWAEGLGTCAEMDMFLFTLFTLCYETVFAGKSPFINDVNIKPPFIYKKLHFHEFPIAMFDRRIVFWLNVRIIELGSTGITKSNQLGGKHDRPICEFGLQNWPTEVWSSKSIFPGHPKTKKNTHHPKPSSRDGDGEKVQFMFYHV